MSKFRHITLALIVAAILALAGCGSNNASDSGKIETGLSPDEISSEAFKDLFPLQYESYGKTALSEEKPSRFNEDLEPLIPILFNGYAFALDHNVARGHAYANIDVYETLRTSEEFNQPGACLTCKSTAVPHMIETMGDDYWGGSFLNDIWPKAESMGHSAIGCSDCHDPVTMDLTITRPSFTKAMIAKGEDMSNPTKNEMRSYVCGQCHVEYHFAADNKEVTFPWDNGFRPEDAYEFYETKAKQDGFMFDFIHNVSGAPMIKAQHPEFETHMEGTHGKAGVSCADCHMPYDRIDGKKKITSHWIKSPMDALDQSCLTCHSNRTEDQLKDRVLEIQDNHLKALNQAMDISTSSHYYVNKMITSGVNEAKIKEVQEIVRKGQWMWDIVAAENGNGFHDPQGQMDSLKKSSDLSAEAIHIATIELTKLGVDIEELESEIAKVKKAVVEEQDHTKKREHATNSYFPPQKK